MKVLWLANSPCGAASHLGLQQYAGGWLSSLDSNLSASGQVELHIGFFHNAHHDSFQIGGTTYHPIHRSKDLASQLIRKFTRGSKVDRDEISRVAGLVSVVDPDIIHVHGTEDNFGLVQEHTQKPVLISLQGILTPLCQKFFSGIPREQARRHLTWKQQVLDRHDYRSLVNRAARERRILSQARWIMGRTDWDRRVASILAPSAQYLVGNEILRKEFYGTSWAPPLSNSPFRIMTTMTGGFYKGFEAILQAAQCLHSAGFRDFEWIVVGQEPGEIFVRLSENFAKIDHRKVGIRLLGKCSPAEIVKHALRSHLYCQVSHIENSPNSLAEAMLMGIPCLASAAGGTFSMIKDGLEGILVQDGDPYALAGAILEVAQNPSAAYERANTGKKIAGRHLPEAVLSEVLQAYGRIQHEVKM